MRYSVRNCKLYNACDTVMFLQVEPSKFSAQKCLAEHVTRLVHGGTVTVQFRFDVHRYAI